MENIIKVIHGGRPLINFGLICNAKIWNLCLAVTTKFGSPHGFASLAEGSINDEPNNAADAKFNRACFSNRNIQ